MRHRSCAPHLGGGQQAPSREEIKAVPFGHTSFIHLSYSSPKGNVFEIRGISRQFSGKQRRLAEKFQYHKRGRWYQCNLKILSCSRNLFRNA